MEIRGNPFAISNKDIAEVAIFFSSSYDEINKVVEKTMLLNSATWRHLESKFEVVELVDTSSSSLKFIVANGAIYCESLILGTYTANTVMVVIFSFLRWGMSEMRRAFTVWKNQREDISQILYYNSEIRRLNGHISERLGNMREYTPFDYPLLQKTAKRLKIKLEMSPDGLFIFHFGKCQSGNEIEGFIQYKDIVLYLDHDFSIHRSIFYFNKWYYDSAWTILSRVLHPHVNITAICFGNRQDDFVSYWKGNHFDFLLMLFKETLNNYSPERPFNSVTAIARFLRLAEKAMPSAKLEENKSEEAKSRKLINYITRRTAICPRCNEYLIDGRCYGENCVNNPEAIINCLHCNNQLVWDNEVRILRCPTCYRCPECGTVFPNATECQNENCESSPLYVEYCPTCGLPMPNSTCENSLCRECPDYVQPSERPNTEPVCRICGDSANMSFYSGDWHCENPLHIGTYQYDEYLAPLGGRAILRDAERFRQLIESQNIECPFCEHLLYRDSSTQTYICENEECDYNGSPVCDFEGHFIN